MVITDDDDPRSLELRARQLTDDPANNSMLIGCYGCPQFKKCGGLHVEEPMFDCLGLCCGNKSACTQMCPNAPERFVAQRREIDDFTFDNVPRTPKLGFASDIEVAELIYHGSCRSKSLSADAVVLRLADLVDFKRGAARFFSRAEVCEFFKISPSSILIVSGVDHDHRIEPWWTLGNSRLTIIAALKAIGVVLVTTPNFSVVLDVPRTDNLHAMKRIALIFAEFQQQGVPSALHPNGRTQSDFARWAKFISERPEIEVLAYEFITGPNLKTRKGFHLEMLAFLANSANRPLDLVVRGDPHVLPFLRQHFRNVIYVDTTAFVKTMKRCKADRAANHMLKWPPVHTARDEFLDDRLQHNVDEQHAYVRNFISTVNSSNQWTREVQHQTRF